MDTKAQRFISCIFDAYLDQPRLMPQRYADRIPELPLHRVVGDYLAGMTDRFCLDEYKRLFEPFETV
jgi:dGTPase